MSRETETKKGVEAAFDYWLASHDVSTPNLIELAIRTAFTNWLEKNNEDIAERIATKCADHFIKHVSEKP